MSYDLTRWWWKANDGIRETTWPGVYNRSRLIGRDDYFELPDWDCYSLSGKAVTFDMPDEPWNHLEIAGGAWGNMSLLAHDMEKGTDSEKTLFERPRGQEITYHQLDKPITGQKIRFTNVEQEQPIGELSAYYVHPGVEPTGVATLRYRLTSKITPDDNPSTKPLVELYRRPLSRRRAHDHDGHARRRARYPRKGDAIRPAHRAHHHSRRLPFADGRCRPWHFLRLGKHGRRPRRHCHRSASAQACSPMPTA